MMPLRPTFVEGYQQSDYLEGFVGGNMVDNCAVLDGGYEAFFLVHGSRDDSRVVLDVVEREAKDIADDGLAGV